MSLEYQCVLNQIHTSKADVPTAKAMNQRHGDARGAVGAGTAAGDASSAGALAATAAVGGALTRSRNLPKKSPASFWAAESISRAPSWAILPLTCELTR